VVVGREAVGGQTRDSMFPPGPFAAPGGVPPAYISLLRFDRSTSINSLLGRHSWFVMIAAYTESTPCAKTPQRDKHNYPKGCPSLDLPPPPSPPPLPPLPPQAVGVSADLDALTDHVGRLAGLVVSSMSIGNEHANLTLAIIGSIFLPLTFIAVRKGAARGSKGPALTKGMTGAQLWEIRLSNQNGLKVELVGVTFIFTRGG